MTAELAALPPLRASRLGHLPQIGAARGPGPQPRQAAVVDVGSGSVRLVVYEIEGRAITPVLNTKINAGLGRGLARTGRLDPAGVTVALTALERFRLILDAHGIDDVMPIGTAAVREAVDGPAFVAAAEARLGATLTVLSGPEEGRTAAAGVLAGDPTANGIVGDLGGSSLELARVGPGGAEAGVTLMLGPFALGDDFLADPALARGRVDGILERARADAQGRTLYAVGGAWRSIGRLDIHQRRHPVLILNHHTMTAAQAKAACAFAIGSEPSALARIPGLSKRRATGLPAAALVLERLIELGGFEEVVISAFGVREGLIYAGLDERERAGDPLLAGVEASLRGAGSGPAFWRALEAWLAPLAAVIGPVFGPARDPLLRAAAVRLADIAARRLPDQRAAVAFAETLAAPIVGVGHVERVFLACAAHHRFAGPADPVDPAGALALLSEPRRLAAQRLGLALRLACDLAARSADLLDATRLEPTDDALTLTLDPRVAVLYDDTARKRLDHLAIALGRQARVG